MSWKRRFQKNDRGLVYNSIKEVARKQGIERERKLANSFEFGDLSLLFSHRVPLVEKLKAIKNFLCQIVCSYRSDFHEEIGRSVGRAYATLDFFVRKRSFIGEIPNSIGERILSYLQKHNFPGYVISVTSYQLDWVLNYLKQWVPSKWNSFSFSRFNVWSCYLALAACIRCHRLYLACLLQS